MLRWKYFIFITFFIVTGCTTMQTQVVDPSMRQIPEPHYVLQGVSVPIQVLFYYAAYEEIRDADGTVIGQPKYLGFVTKHDIYAGKVKAITLTIEVANPTELEYSIYQNTIIDVRKMGEVKQGNLIGKSRLKYRQFHVQLPYNKDIRKVNHDAIVRVDNNDIMMLGPFNYNLIH